MEEKQQNITHEKVRVLLIIENGKVIYSKTSVG